MVYVTVGTGIGGGLILGGKLYAGATGAAGEIGHMAIGLDGPLCGCGDRGCWEAFASGTAIARDALERLNKSGQASTLRKAVSPGLGEKVTARLVSEAAQRGDALAQEIMHKAAFYLSVGLANLVNLFNPERIVVGGGLTQNKDALFEEAFQTARSRALALHGRTVEFKVTELGDDAGLRGALMAATDVATRALRAGGGTRRAKSASARR